MATRTTVGGAEQPRSEPPHVEVIATVSRCVMTLEQIGAAADLDSHQVAEHIDRLTQQLAGAAIDALRGVAVVTTLLQMLLAFIGVMAFGIAFTVLWCCWVDFVSDLWQAHVVRPREARRAHAAALVQIEADTSERLARLSAAYVEASKEIRRIGETQRWLNS